MEILGIAFSWVAAILALGFLIFVHELGHFLVAKASGVGVVEFAIGFGKKLWQFRWGETYYSLRVIPLGGYVRMIGDDPHELYGSEEEDEAPAAHERALTGEDKQDQETDELYQKMHADRGRWFLSQRLPIKIAIVLAGPLANLLCAWGCAVLLYAAYGVQVPVDEPVVGELIPGYPAEEAGLERGDRIVEVNGAQVASWEEMAKHIAASGGDTLNLLVRRETAESAEPEELRITVAAQEEGSEIAVIEGREPTKRFMIGISPSVTSEAASLPQSFYFGANYVGYIALTTVRGIVGMIRGLISPKHIGGPIVILNEAAKSASGGFERLLRFLVFLGVSLAILNLLPIPILDGGHLMFFLIEAVLGGPVSLRVQQVANQVGMILLLCLMVFALGNDIARVLGVL